MISEILSQVFLRCKASGAANARGKYFFNENEYDDLFLLAVDSPRSHEFIFSEKNKYGHYNFPVEV